MRWHGRSRTRRVIKLIKGADRGCDRKCRIVVRARSGGGGSWSASLNGCSATWTAWQPRWSAAGVVGGSWSASLKGCSFATWTAQQPWWLGGWFFSMLWADHSPQMSRCWHACCPSGAKAGSWQNFQKQLRVLVQLLRPCTAAIHGYCAKCECQALSLFHCWSVPICQCHAVLLPLAQTLQSACCVNVLHC